MSMPIIEKPKNPICREESVSGLIESVALMEAGLSHIINAEGEKLQKVIKVNSDEDVPVEDLIKVNKSVEKMVSTIAKLEMILQSKLETVIELDNDKSINKDRVHCFKDGKEPLGCDQSLNRLC